MSTADTYTITLTRSQIEALTRAGHAELRRTPLQDAHRLETQRLANAVRKLEDTRYHNPDAQARYRGPGRSHHIA